jgi:hypothetical protein
MPHQCIVVNQTVFGPPILNPRMKYPVSHRITREVVAGPASPVGCCCIP